MAEHGARYASLARFLNARGVVIYAIDHRGHGKSVRTRDEIGHFTTNSVESGWRSLCRCYPIASASSCNSAGVIGTFNGFVHQPWLRYPSWQHIQRTYRLWK